MTDIETRYAELEGRFETLRSQAADIAVDRDRWKKLAAEYQGRVSHLTERMIEWIQAAGDLAQLDKFLKAQKDERQEKEKIVAPLPEEAAKDDCAACQ